MPGVEAQMIFGIWKLLFSKNNFLNTWAWKKNLHSCYVYFIENSSEIFAEGGLYVVSCPTFFMFNSWLINKVGQQTTYSPSLNKFAEEVYRVEWNAKCKSWNLFFWYISCPNNQISGRENITILCVCIMGKVCSLEPPSRKTLYVWPPGTPTKFLVQDPDSVNASMNLDKQHRRQTVSFIAAQYLSAWRPPRMP